MLRSGLSKDRNAFFVQDRRETSVQSPRIIASFFVRLQPLICRSLAKASSRVGNSSFDRIRTSLCPSTIRPAHGERNLNQIVSSLRRELSRTLMRRAENLFSTHAKPRTTTIYKTKGMLTRNKSKLRREVEYTSLLWFIKGKRLYMIRRSPFKL